MAAHSSDGTTDTEHASPFARFYGNEPLSKRAWEEEAILAFWKERRVFERSLERPAPKGEFVFYEGPPTANGRPGIHHLVSRAFKDLIPRYRTMRGWHVRRKAGWDTHGLPVEVEVEKKLGLKSKRDVESYGIERFNALCRESVWEYAREWEQFTERIGFWIDLANAYVTYHPEYIESLWWIVRQLHDRNLLYRDYKVVPWCPRCGTPLSSHELAQEYREVEDRAVYVRFPVQGRENEFLLAWTTTPWTLPGNVALAVHPDLTYAKVCTDDGAYWVARERVEALFGSEARICEEVEGSALVGVRYEPLWQGVPLLWSEDERARALQVYPAEFVSAEEGTGIVHTAVMYGQEDFELGSRYQLPKRHLVAEDGTFIPEEALGDLGGRFVKEEETEQRILAHLKQRELLWREERIVHSYPFCWRCKERVLYYAHTSWFIRMSALRDVLISENKEIHWEPEHIRDGRFGEWLSSVKDWAVSRNRFWATPLPVWESADRRVQVVVESIAQLRAMTPSRRNRFWMLRHGEAQSNVEGYVDDGRDASNGLTGNGQEAVRKAAAALKEAGISVIYTSPLRRARETAEIVRRELGLPEDAVRVDERLREVGVGELQGASLDRWREAMGPVRERFGQPPAGAESWEAVRRRVAEALFAIDAAHEGDRILIVSHQTPLALLASAFAARGAAWTERNYHSLPQLATAEVRELGEFRPYPHNAQWEVDLHRPYVDDWVLEAQDGTKLRRVEEVMDVWFDSGAMPLAQDHYPFEHKEWVDGPGYPADFICEGVDQTRGWFYTLHALGVALGRGKAYRAAISVGHILDKEGKKMSKSLGNIVDPWQMAARYGVDVLRLYMYSVNQPGMPRLFDEQHLKELERNFFNLVENTLRFYELYRHPSDGETGGKGATGFVMDAWLASRTAKLEQEVRTHLDAYKVFEAARALLAYADDLSRWYVRRVRSRMRGLEGEAAHRAASRALREALHRLARIAAPFLPFLAERLFAAVRFPEDPESVHLADWPPEEAVDEALLARMEAARTIVSEALRQRDAAGIRVRQPLATLTLREDPAGIAGDVQLAREVREEVNVQEIRVDPNAPTNIVLDTTITEDLRQLGWLREAQRLMQEARKKAGLQPKDAAVIELAVAPEAEVRFQEEREHLARAVHAKELRIVVDASLSRQDPPVQVQEVRVLS